MTTSTALLFVLILTQATSDRPAVLESVYSAQPLALDPDPRLEVWTKASPVIVGRDYLARPIQGTPMEVRSRWTKQDLYLLYSCPYDRLNLKPDPNLSAETPRLWNWDVAEAFIGSDFDNIGRYKEFQVSPQGEWVDLAIDRSNPKGQEGRRWDSSFSVKTRVDPRARFWYGLMRIPFSAIDTRPPEPGLELRVGLYRIAGVAPSKQHYAWQPTGQTTFHVPQAFGTLRLR
ncbi:MAG: carbohydrate-binding family 9-like protein [Vicinamibacteraceae bacterium]